MEAMEVHIQLTQTDPYFYPMHGGTRHPPPDSDPVESKKLLGEIEKAIREAGGTWKAERESRQEEMMNQDTGPRYYPGTAVEQLFQYLGHIDILATASAAALTTIIAKLAGQWLKNKALRSVEVSFGKVKVKVHGHDDPEKLMTMLRQSPEWPSIIGAVAKGGAKPPGAESVKPVVENQQESSSPKIEDSAADKTTPDRGHRESLRRRAAARKKKSPSNKARKAKAKKSKPRRKPKSSVRR
jgi:hypothetical protein